MLDADALNAIAADAGLHARCAPAQRRAVATVLTPHPLEAARLLGYDAAVVQADRLQPAQPAGRALRLRACVLKGSGSVTAAPTSVPSINPTGNARLASAGTGDVLAGLVGGRLGAGSADGEAPPARADARRRPACCTATRPTAARRGHGGQALRAGELISGCAARSRRASAELPLSGRLRAPGGPRALRPARGVVRACFARCAPAPASARLARR